MKIRRKPVWLRVPLPSGEKVSELGKLIQDNNLHTICTSGNCPNRAECWKNGTATFMILGDICTRGCRFCNVATGKPLPVDINEPVKIARAIKILNLKHCVITSVDRDDLPDGGAKHWQQVILEVKKANPQTTMEVLIPDFNGNTTDLDTVAEAKPEVISHNLETVERLTPLVRSRASYRKSLEVLKYLAEQGVKTKSGIMLGLGETMEEIEQVMDDLLSVNCKIITIGQYLQPTQKHLNVEKYYHPDEFSAMEVMAKRKGFTHAECSPLVRSSYHAEKHV